MVNQERLWNRLMALGKIGKQASGGITRLSFTSEERAAKDLVRQWMNDAGLEVREDAVGNLIGRKHGTDLQAPVVMAGSHIDSVLNGGNFDGPLGVLSALEALQCMNEAGVETHRSIEVVAFTDEEGARFRFGMTGSRGMAGKLTAQELEATDEQGVSIADAMREWGFDPARISDAARPQGSVHAYVELHIEQGKILERADLPVGVVTGLAGPLWLKFSVTGQAGHAGTTPMSMRHDALVGAAEIIQVIEQEAARQDATVATVGQMNLFPGGVNIIPGRVEFTLDLRDVNAQTRSAVDGDIRRLAQQICDERGLSLDVETLQDIAPVHCQEDVQDAVYDACATLGIRTIPVVSGAGHDCMQLRDLCPVGMIFVRSKDGVSHHPDEWSSPEDCATGASVLYHTLLKLASLESDIA
ncbi:Zn-dependent hydrolase [Alicyclobacillus fastidiosus]|uniref:Zn-dependent hydrolase n=1 Tax=Alicyclobacillus fastidiosus TaxID=392011 RepID=A0ABY6ZNU4_9BACL|nr:Zn-dependent hydrolase [Alicyclobacillus fastidiosus]WAH44506.1 Zn-dependent hydrolase [Alicyclobacillus fastidiosus]